ncbi:DUF2461 domain-containing protein [Spongiimicrobium salis]|uniref:DUF2461 domain-containing protein n=1 Tax=Spongiimicrobium salis TaxID=1667022 RepID=UPI00374DEDDA
MSKVVVSEEILDFYRELEENNNRDWFNAQKKRFKSLEDKVKEFYRAIEARLNVHDEIEKMKIFRIYRDVRFSNDKTPFKTHFAGSFSRAGARNRGGYYLQIKPGKSFMATGFWAPSKEDLFRIRKEFELDASEMREVMNEASFKKMWGTLEGDAVKTAPKGFDKTHPDIDLIKQKQFIFTRHFTDKEVLSERFLDTVDSSFKAIRPYFDLMSDILTTNLNGESLLD